MKRKLVFLLAFALAASSIIGCNSTPTVDSSTSDNSSSISASETLSDTGTLYLDWASAVGTDSVLGCPWNDKQGMYPDMVFDTLIKLDTDGQTILPGLASKCEISEDGLTYTFTLAENAVWHDGTAFTAQDVLFSFNTVIKVPESTMKGAMTKITGVQDVIDGKAETASGITAEGNTVIFKLDSADNSIVLNVFAGFNILPEHLLGDVDPTLFSQYEDYWKKPIGTGPYVIDEMVYPDYFTVVRNENYFGKKANIKNVVFTSHVTGGNESIIADMIAGKLDFVYGNAINDIATAANVISKNTDIKMIIAPATYQRQFWFNNVGSQDGKYNDDMQKKEVRQAINLLLDKDALANFYEGQAVALSTWVNPELDTYNSDIPVFKRDVEKAKAMLEAAGFDFTRTIRILYYYDDQTTKDFMELVKQNFADAGVTAEPFLATGDLASIIYEVKNWDIMYAGNGFPDPIITYQTLIPDGGIVDGLFGDVEMRQETFGTLINEYKSATTPQEMKTIGDEIQAAAYDYSLIIPIYGLNKICMYNSQKLKLDEKLFSMDLFGYCDYQFDKWELLK